MNLATDRPDLLLQNKFSDITFTLHSYRDSPDEGQLYQDWKSETFSIFFTYSLDLSVSRAHNSINLDVLPENSWYHKYKTYVPPVIAELQKSKPYTLSSLSEDLLTETVSQTWICNNESVTVYLNDALEVVNYNIHINNEEGVTSTEYAGNGNCIESRVEKNDGLWHKQFYFNNGHLKADYTETSQGIRVGMAYYYNEDGSLMAEHNFDTFPYSPVGYKKAKEIAEQAGVVPHKTGLGLYWRIADDSYLPALYIDAVSGGYEPCTTPATEEKEVKTSRIYEVKPFAAYLTDLVGIEGLFMDDGETISEAQDYIRIFGDLTKITSPGFDVEKLTVVDRGSQWEVEAVINKVTRSFMIKGDTDWFDDAFIKNINGMLRDSGSAYTFYSVQDETWGQEMGFIYIHDSLADSIRALLGQPGREQFWGSNDNFVDRSSL